MQLIGNIVFWLLVLSFLILIGHVIYTEFNERTLKKKYKTWMDKSKEEDDKI